MRIILTCCIALMILGCKSKKNSMPDQVNNNSNSEQTIKLKAEIGDTDVATALTDITNVRLEGNILFLDIAYSGGCKDHEFKLVGSPMIAKSLPPIRAIKLIHNNNDDNCRAYIMKTLEIDIHQLAYIQEKGSVIHLTLDGWKDRITYTFE